MSRKKAEGKRWSEVWEHFLERVKKDIERTKTEKKMYFIKKKKQQKTKQQNHHPKSPSTELPEFGCCFIFKLRFKSVPLSHLDSADGGQGALKVLWQL